MILNEIETFELIKQIYSIMTENGFIPVFLVNLKTNSITLIFKNNKVNIHITIKIMDLLVFPKDLSFEERLKYEITRIISELILKDKVDPEILNNFPHLIT